MGALSDLYAAEIKAHRQWLSTFGPERARRWERLLTSNEEAALCEACVRELMEKHVDHVEPAEDLEGGGPDFLCAVGEARFYVEATCLASDAVTGHTGLSARLDPKAGFRSYDDLTAKVQAAVKKKTPQCSDLDAPCLLAVGTFHFEASGLCGDELHTQHLLTSKTDISMAFDPEVGEFVGDMIPTTDLEYSSVLRGVSSTLAEAERRPISGILLCGFGCEVHGEGWPVRGVLHPDSVRPFPRGLLPRIRFCELEPGFERGVLTPKWT